MGFLACWRIHFGRVLTLAFIPSLLLDEGHCLYLQNYFPLFSFIPAFLPILHTRAWVRESDTSEEREENSMEGRQIEKEKGQRWRQLEGRVDRYFRETWEDVAWPCFLDVQDTVLKMAIKLIKAQMVHELLAVLYRILTVSYSEIILFTASPPLS